jgi:nickel-dependent lactate racemase
VRVVLRYGSEGLALDLPEHWDVTVAAKPSMPLLEDPRKALREAFASPVASPPLLDLAKGKKRVCILICDITRPVPNALLLEGLQATLREAGVPDSAVTVLVATGLHRPNDGEELAALVGCKAVLNAYQVENHYAARTEDHAFLGETPGGVPVGVDRRFAEADLKIVTGLIEPHFMAGYSGGRKVVAPGVCHETTIRAFHSAGIMGDAAARNLNLRDNPLHREQMHIVGLLSPVYAVNTVIDDERRLAFVNFGEVEASHNRAVSFAEPYFSVPVSRGYATIITSAAGAPLDMTYYQVVKGLVGVKAALAPGGKVYIAAECGEGLGSPDFRRSQAELVHRGAQGFLRYIRKKARADIDEWQTQKLTEILLLGDAILYSPLLSAEDRDLTAIGYTEDIVRSVTEWIAQCGDPRILVVPEGPYVIPGK